MVMSIAMLVVSCVSVVLATSVNRKAHIGKVKIHLYWVVPLACAIVLLATDTVPAAEVAAQLFGDSRMNPLKILTYFIAMSALSVYLDKVGFFKLLAAKVLKHAGESQLKLFILLYLIVACVTLFTSNSTIVLTFTPFICYFAKHSNINPVPYIFMEFVAANTWSMFLIIGNVTNVYIATSFGIGFAEFVQYMALPTIFAAITSFLIVFLMFRKHLKAPLSPSELEVSIRNKPAFIIGLIGLLVCIVMLFISSYIGLETWYIALISAAVVLLAGTFCFVFKRQAPLPVIKTIRRLPWHLVPFLLSMFVIVLGLMRYGVTGAIASVFDNRHVVLSMGSLSAVFSNLMNNQPMSMFFVGILSSLSESNLTAGIFASVVGSNMGSLFTPVASMSAIMWLSIVKHKNVKFNFFDFVKHGVVVAVPTLAAALGGVAIMLAVL